MFDSKFIFTLVGLIVAVLAICKFNIGNTSEQFTNGLISKVVSTRPGYSKITGSLISTGPNHQSNLSPRISGTSVSSAVGNRLPPNGYQGVSKNPLDGCQVKYVASKPSAVKMAETVEKFTTEEDSNYQIQNFSKPINVGTATPTFGTTTEYDQNNLPEDMTVDVEVVDGNTYVYDRLIYANQNSRTRGAGDWIRGDLPIVPDTTCGWFVSQYADPQTSLNTGALGAMAGFNEQTNSLGNLLYQTSRGTNNYVGGVQMSHNYEVVDGGPLTVVEVNSFP